MAQATPPRADLRPLLLLVAVLFGLWAVWATLVLPRLGPAEGPEYFLRSVAIRSLLWVLPSAVYLRIRYGQVFYRPLRLGLPPTLRHWILSLGLIAAASVAVSLDVARKLAIPLGEVWLRLVDSFEWTVLMAPLFEEMVFRGVILGELVLLLRVGSWRDLATLEGRARFWLANILASLVFTGLHWPWWIYSLGLTSTRFWMNTVGVFALSVVLGLLFVQGRSIWPCVILHGLNNALTALAA